MPPVTGAIDDVVRAALAVVHELVVARSPLQRVERESLRSELDTRQPTMHRENTSMTNATSTQAAQVATYVMSAIHSWFGRVAVSSRCTRSERGRVGDRLDLGRRTNSTAQVPSAGAASQIYISVAERRRTEFSPADRDRAGGDQGVWLFNPANAHAALAAHAAHAAHASRGTRQRGARAIRLGARGSIARPRVAHSIRYRRDSLSRRNSRQQSYSYSSPPPPGTS